MVSGPAFLRFDDHYVKELGIKAIAHRQYLMQAIEWLRRSSPKFQAQQQKGQQGPKALSSEDELSSELLLDIIDRNTSLDNPLKPTTPNDATNPNLLHNALSPAQTEGKKPRRMETTITQRPPLSSLLEPPSTHQKPAPNPTFGNEAFFDHLMETYPPNDADVLSLLGESSSEGEYDTETREEMEEDERQFRLDTSPDTSGTLGDAEFNEIVDEYINSRKSQFVEIRLPKEQPNGFQIWARGQKFPSMKSQISTRLVHLEKRFQALRKALAEAQHSSRSSLLQACACLDPTVIDICLDRWRLSVLEKASPPAKIARPPRNPRPKKPNVNSDGEETLSSDSDCIHDTEDENMSSDLDSVRDTGEMEDNESLKTSEDDFEEGEIAQDEKKPHPRAAYRSGPFHDYSSDEDLSHLFYKEENYEPPAAKRRRLEKDSVHQDSPTSPLMTMTILPFDRDVALPANEREADSHMETKTHLIDPMRPKIHESVDSASDDGSETDVHVFDDVSSMTWDTIEEGGNRIYVIAKALTGLPNSRINQLSKFLGTYMLPVYQELTREGLKNMSDDSSVMEGRDPEESHSIMLMTTLFVSWANVIRVPSGGFEPKQVKVTLSAVHEDNDEDGFPFFLDCLNDLVKEYEESSISPSRIQSDKTNIRIRRQRRRRKRAVARMTMNPAQKEGQERQKKQALLESRLGQGHVHKEITAVPVSFQEPIIYLDSHIAQHVKPHQISGIQFMFREIVENKREEGCLLAHTMGLGKSMQVISLLTTISAAAASQDPTVRNQIPDQFRKSKTLLLCPAALIQNWCNEFAMWSPENNKLGQIRPVLAKHSGSRRNKEIGAWNDAGGVLIISYQIFRKLVQNNTEQNEDQEQQSINENIKFWLLNSPNIVVADEAQNLRNQKSRIAEATSRFRTRKRIALSGTPLSNGVEDYYWLVEWVAHHYLGPFADFNDLFIKPIENGSHIESTRAEQREALQRQALFLRIIEPKVQRVDMSTLTDELPPKHEFCIYLELTELQKGVYNLFVDDLRLGKVQSVSTKLLSFLNLLQLCCIHPALFKTQLESRDVKRARDNQTCLSSDEIGTSLGVGIPAQENALSGLMSCELESLLNRVPDLLNPSLSSRVTILNEIVNQAIALGDKVLVFSSSILALNYLAEFMDKTQRNYCLIDGNVGPARRPERIRIFDNDPTTHVCFVSTHAGGIGFNIQTANRIVIFDFLFNPTWEEQAVGRAYRIGQKKPVYVYRMIAGGTFEEKLYRMNVFKNQLAYRMVDKKNPVRMGSKSQDPYLAHCTASSEKRSIEKSVLEADAGMINGILSSECAASIITIKLSGPHVDPGDILTTVERQTVEDELRVQRLRLDSR
ncbi:hypothetical protein PCG10_009585 [Penicillium crustosum]|uniref:Uncharacterized protein n=2 Tax=Penicillium crustosum TaxID=36656 RepID=A0A9P5GQ62_PENCR|nr:hypothetical protein PCG10_009585 [Penicillium crustosum]